MLLGDRIERRTGEEIAKMMMKFIGVLFIGKLSKYKGIEGWKVAKAMVKSIHEKTGTEILESDKIQKI